MSTGNEDRGILENLTTENWRIGKIADYIDSNSNEKKLIEIPKFQRGIVWGPPKIERLVDSLFRSFPVGSLLAYESGTRGDKRVYQLVDGLQRSNAIAAFSKAPLKYASAENLFELEVFETISRQLKLPLEEDCLEAKSLVQSWLSQIGSLDSPDFLNANFKKFLSNGSNEVRIRLEESEELLERALLGVRNRVQDVLSSSIPVLVYDGPEENIPEIFERINSQATQLSKYEILASSWIRTATRIKNQKVVEAIREKYKDWVNAGFVVSDELLNEAHEQGNLYEYLMGLSKEISRSFPILFGSDGDSEDVAFQIFTVISGLPVAKMRDLPSQLERDSEDFINPEFIEQAVISACKSISHRLEAYIGIKGNKSSDELRQAHSQNQIISLITSLVVSAYDLNTGKVVNHKAEKDILENLPAHYLLDILRKAWKGSGDSKLFDRTWQKADGDELRRPAYFYQSEVYREVFTGAFEQWNLEQLSKTQTSRPNLQKDVLTVLRFLYSGIITHHQDKLEVFEVEHIYPVIYCSRIIKESGDTEGWPISAIGNLMLLPKKINRIKGEKLLGPELARLKDLDKLPPHEEAHIQNYLMQPMIEEVVADLVVTKNDYLDFCAHRLKVIVEKLCDNLKLRPLSLSQPSR